MRVLIILSFFSITACGVRGDLYLPEDSVTVKAEEQNAPQQPDHRHPDEIERGRDEQVENNR